MPLKEHTIRPSRQPITARLSVCRGAGSRVAQHTEQGRAAGVASQRAAVNIPCTCAIQFWQLLDGDCTNGRAATSWPVTQPTSQAACKGLAVLRRLPARHVTWLRNVPQVRQLACGECSATKLGTPNSSCISACLMPPAESGCTTEEELAQSGMGFTLEPLKCRCGMLVYAAGQVTRPPVLCCRLAPKQAPPLPAHPVAVRVLAPRKRAHRQLEAKHGRRVVPPEAQPHAGQARQAEPLQPRVQSCCLGWGQLVAGAAARAVVGLLRAGAARGLLRSWAIQRGSLLRAAGRRRRT